MCGIVGFVDRGRRTIDPGRVIRHMAKALRHRGPDAEGFWTDDQSGVALGHRRLAIIDVSPAGSQPMISADGRWVISYNGEVYNFAELRRELTAKGVTFCGHSDTEVVLEACAAWGPEATLPRLVGMFALAVWDRRERRLVLARDQIGIKPLYWGECGATVFFGSELKGFAPHPAWCPTINREAVTAFMRFNYIPAPQAIWNEAHKLPAGTMLSLTEGGPPVVAPFWTLASVVAHAREHPLRLADDEAVTALDALLGDAVRGQMVADVPIGAFLSGGIDSSTVVALMQAHSNRPVRTFTIGFHEAGYDEAKHAAAVARHLGTDHTELYIDPAQAQKVVPHLAEWYDEPFADSSQVPTCLVSRLARQEVTVVLSGDGGDESFAGYGRYQFGEALLRERMRLPPLVRRAVATALDAVQSMLPRSLSGQWLARKGYFLGERLRQASNKLDEEPETLYLGMLSQWQDPERVVVGGQEPYTLITDRKVRGLVADFLSQMQYLDTLLYLPDDILVKVDRASMAVGLESRVPLLDHRVVEFAWHLPRRFKMRNGQSKWLLRQVLQRYVPAKLSDRPKMGFGVPIDAWLRGPLKEWAWSRLAPQVVAHHGLLAAGPILAAWEAHQSGRQDLHYPLWTALMLQDWLMLQEGTIP